MWPKQFDAWCGLYAADAEHQVRGRLRQYPVLLGFEQHLLGQGIQRARLIGQYLTQYADYFAVGQHFRRWLRVVLYREVLRLTLQVEPVEAALTRLTEPERRVLRLRYVDQLSDEELARVLGLTAAGPKLFDLPAAWAQSLAAYRALCAALPKAAARDGVVAAAGFPLFPVGNPPAGPPLPPRATP